MTKASIIVTSYNIASFIEACLADVAAQTLEDFEVIVVDDGSSDGSAQIIEDFCRDRPNFRAILFEKNTQGGVGTAANAGLDAATGEFVGFADGDDRYDPDMFRRLIEAAETHGTDIALCDYYLLDTATGNLELPADAFRWDRITPNQRVDLDQENRRSLLRFIPVPWRKIYRRSLLEDHRIRFPEVDHFFEDNPFHWEVCLRAQSAVFVDERLCKHRVNRTGQTMNSSPVKLLEVIRNHDLILDVLERCGVR